MYEISYSTYMMRLNNPYYLKPIVYFMLILID
jgi:hypothetical protein